MSLKNFPIIDNSKINFPSDSLTFGMLRRHYPQDFDSDKSIEFHQDSSKMGEAVWSVLWVERSIAKAAFNVELGNKEYKDPLNALDREGCLNQVAELYTRFGLASGRHAADLLFRGIEAQARVQAEQHLGRRP